MTTPTSGTDATSRPASELDSRRSASESRSHGIASSATVNSTMGRQRGRRARRLTPERSTKGRSTAAPIAVRRKTRVAGVSSRTATLMSRYGIPQITHSARNNSQPRRVTPPPLMAGTSTGSAAAPRAQRCTGLVRRCTSRCTPVDEPARRAFRARGGGPGAGRARGAQAAGGGIGASRTGST